MDIEQRIVTSDMGFRRLLDLNNIKYEDSKTGSLILKINESNSKWEIVKEYITNNDIPSLTTAKFTKFEMNNASWLTMRSKWRWEYPMPDNDGGYKDVVYDTNNYCNHCGIGLVQKDLFRIRKSPNWGKKHFFMLNWVEDELFVSEKAKCVLNESSLKGFDFVDVLKYKKETKIDNIYQLKITNTLSPGFIPVEKQIKKHIVCQNCNLSKWITSGTGFSFKESIIRDDIDIAKSFESFGFGTSASKKILVSQKFYRTVVENKLDDGLEFIPIDFKGHN